MSFSLPLPCRLIGDWRRNVVTPQLAKKMLGLKCTNLDGPTVLSVTTLFWYVLHVKRCWSVFFLSSSKLVHPQLEWFKILDAFKKEYLPCTILVYLACGKVLKSVLTILIYLILIITIHFFIWQNNEKFVLSILFSKRSTLCARRLVIFSNFFTCLKTFCRGQYGESH
jgi:hypothetical protein